MEVIGALASVTQLTAYSKCVAESLLRLYKAAQDGPSSAQEQCKNIEGLRMIIGRIGCYKYSEPDSLTALLVDIAKIAETLTNWLRQEKKLRKAWISLTKAGKIDDAFQALHSKTEQLHLYLSERSFCTLRQIQVNLHRSGHAVDNMDLDPPHTKVLMD